ncbi:SH3 domain-containing protein [Tenacibaculum amylolyticum]|uniref:hypothetical protein n=1 Tax=Tenacibaculum amylolyticum TaxID=104269 RepID=UPI003894ED39
MKELIKKIYQASIALAIVLGTVLLLNNETEELPKRKKHTEIIACASIPEARCTGSPYCRACKNCSRCKHCNSGGSCGVCERKRTISIPKKKVLKRTKYEVKEDKEQRKNYMLKVLNEEPTEKYSFKKLLRIKEAKTPLRSGAGESYYVIQKLKKYEELMLLSVHGEWLRVKVKRTKTIGFVHFRDVYTDI